MLLAESLYLPSHTHVARFLADAGTQYSVIHLVAINCQELPAVLDAKLLDSLQHGADGVRSVSGCFLHAQLACIASPHVCVYPAWFQRNHTEFVLLELVGKHRAFCREHMCQ